MYLFVLINYFFSETGDNFRRRVVNKVILASMFLAYGLAAFFLRYDVTSLHLLLMIGLLFAWLGDVLLLFSFIRGGVLFLIGNIFFICYEIFLIGELSMSLKDLWIAIVVFSAFWGTALVFSARKLIDFGGKRNLMLAYLSTVTFHGSVGLAMIKTYPCTKTALLGAGLALFMVSDYFLMLHKFKCPKSKAILRCNSGTYFTGMMLVVLGMSL